MSAYALDIDHRVFYVPSVLSFSMALCKLHSKRAWCVSTCGSSVERECLKYLYLQNLEADLQNAKGKKKKKKYMRTPRGSRLFGLITPAI